MTEKTTPGKKTRASRRGKTLSETEKAEAIALWKAGTVTLGELSERFHRDRSTFVRLFNSVGAAKGENREEHSQKVTEAVQSAVISDVAVRAARIRETVEEHYKIAKFLANENYKILVKCKQENRSISTAMPELKSIQVMIANFKILREERYALLNMNDDKGGDDAAPPPLVIQELTADEIKAMHKSMGEDDDIGLDQLTTLEGEGDL